MHFSRVAICLRRTEQNKYPQGFLGKKSASSVKLGIEIAAYDILSNPKNGFTWSQMHDHLRSDN